MRRVLAIIGVILLLSMYIATFVFAVIDSPNSDGWLMASIYCTIVIPVLLYGYTLIYRYLKNKNNSITDSAIADNFQEEEK